MHELSITQSVVDVCAGRAAGAKVLRVRLEIGALAGVVPDAIRFCFDLCAKGTVVEGAGLEIIETPGRARCRDCTREVVLTTLYGTCACGSANLQWTAGEALKVLDMEVTECA